MLKVRMLSSRARIKPLALRRAGSLLVKRTPYRIALEPIIQKRKRPIRVVFVCGSGVWMSQIVREWFSQALEKEGVPKSFFSLSSESMELPRSKHAHNKVDYFVFTLPGILEHIAKRYPKLFKSIKEGSKIIPRENAGATVDAEGNIHYPVPLKEIIKRERAKLR